MYLNQTRFIILKKLPELDEAKQKFANLFKDFNNHLEAAQIQGFIWDRSEYICEIKPGEPKEKSPPYLVSKTI